MNTTTNTIPTATIKTTRHVGPGQHRASKKSNVEDLTIATESRRRSRLAKQTSGRRRADTNKINLAWFIPVMGFFIVTFAAVFGVLLGMGVPEPVVMLQTQTKTVTNTIGYTTVPEVCSSAFTQADKGFEKAQETPKVQLIKVGKHKEISKPVKMNEKFMKSLQISVGDTQNKYEPLRDKCLATESDGKLESSTVEYDTNTK